MEYISLTRFALAFLLVIALIGLMGLVLRRYAVQRGWQAESKAERRLRVLEMLPLGGQQRLLLVQRDDTAHLLLVSPQGSMVVEQHIALTQAGKNKKDQADEE